MHMYTYVMFNKYTNLTTMDMISLIINGGKKERLTLILEEISTDVENCLCTKMLSPIPFHFFLHYYRMTATITHARAHTQKNNNK